MNIRPGERLWYNLYKPQVQLGYKADSVHPGVYYCFYKNHTSLSDFGSGLQPVQMWLCNYTSEMYNHMSDV